MSGYSKKEAIKLIKVVSVAASIGASSATMETAPP